MNESYPEKAGEFLDVLVVDSEAGWHAQSRVAAIKRGDEPIDTMRENLEANDPQLCATMESLIEGWGLSEAEAGTFREGFSLTYTALQCQAKLLDTDLPLLDEAIAIGFTYELSKLENGGSAYCQEQAKFLSKHNGYLVEVWEKYYNSYNKSMPAEEKFSFLVGGIMAHDILRDQVNASQIVEKYSSSLN